MTRRALILAVLLFGGLVPAVSAHAAVPVKAAPQQDVAIPLIPESNSAFLPPGFSVTVGQALKLAEHTPRDAATAPQSASAPCGPVLLMPRSHYEVDFWYHDQADGRGDDLAARQSGGYLLRAARARPLCPW